MHRTPRSSLLLVTVAAPLVAVGCAPIHWRTSAHGSASGFAAPANAAPAPGPSGDPMAAPGPGSTTEGDRPAMWRRFAVRDLVLGTSLGRLTGFTCHGDGWSRHCDKILNPEVCLGPCTTEQAAVEYLRVMPTATDSQRIYAIEYRFRSTDYLSADSRLGAALIQKYGTPDVLEPEYRQRALWQVAGLGSSGPEVEIFCGSGACTLVARDDGLRIAESKRQDAIDIERQKARATPPPSL